MTKRTSIGFAFVAAVALVVPAIGHAAGATKVAGVPTKLVGLHGPTSDVASGALELVGKTDLAPPGKKTALGNNGGIALIDHCAYVGRWHDYNDTSAKVPTPQQPIQIVDIANPKSPKVIKGGVAGSMIEHAVAREIRGIDLPRFRMLTVLTFGKYTDEAATTPGQNAMHFFLVDAKDCRKVTKAGSYDMKAFRGHEFYQFVDPNPDHNVNGHPRVLEFVTTPLSGADGIVIDASDPANPKLISAWNGGQGYASATEATGVTAGVKAPAGAGRYSHSISMSSDGRTAFISQWDGGVYAVDTGQFADGAANPVMKPIGAKTLPFFYDIGRPGNTHSTVPVPGSDVMVVGDEIYVTTDGCPFGWMHLLSQGTADSRPKLYGTFKLPENEQDWCGGKLSLDLNSRGLQLDGTFSMHNQTATKHFAIATWYGGGVRAVDISDPEQPKEAGFFMPKPATSTISVPDTSAPIWGATEDVNDDWWVSMWSYPIIRGGLIYVSDIRNGLYILRAKAKTPLAKELAGIKYLEGNSNLDALKH